jgi:hypothetical protein
MSISIQMIAKPPTEGKKYRTLSGWRFRIVINGNMVIQ